MSQSNPGAQVFQRKAQFFTHLKQNDPTRAKSIEEQFDFADLQAKSITYGTILDNQSSLETEFATLFATLKRRKKENDEAFWIYCYYCASLLETFHHAYSQEVLKKRYAVLKEQIKDRLIKREEAKKAQTEESFIKSVETSFVTGFRNLATAPAHLSKLREYVGFTNLCRLYWVFCRLTITTGLAFARDTHIIDQLDAILGTHTDVDKIISTLQIPNGVLNYFSVGLFLARFAIDGGLLIKHTFFPGEEEKNSSMMQRFQHELYKRHGNFANDLVWATVNLLTNFNYIPSPVNSAVIAVFLGFDVSMTIYNTFLARREYLLKKAEMEDEIKKLDAMGISSEIQKAQLEQLTLNWKANEAKCYFVVAAATLFMMGFTGAIVFASPALITASFFMCLVAGNMYLASGTYKEYQTKKFAMEQSDLTLDERRVARKEFEIARNDFMVSIIKNTTIPTVLIATFAVCWPAAVVLSALYISYEIYHAYDQHQAKKSVHTLALPKDIEEGSDDILEVNEGTCFACSQ